MEDKRVTEIYCHACDGYIRISLDYSLSGNHEVPCPECGHIHWRVIKDGEVTEDRYRFSAGPTITATTTGANYHLVSASATSTATNVFLAESWLNTTSTS
jgi:hypothetical protein